MGLSGINLYCAKESFSIQARNEPVFRLYSAICLCHLGCAEIVKIKQIPDDTHVIYNNQDLLLWAAPKWFVTIKIK